MFSKSEGNIQAGSTISKTSKFSPASFADGMRSGRANKRSRGNVGKKRVLHVMTQVRCRSSHLMRNRSNALKNCLGLCSSARL